MSLLTPAGLAALLLLPPVLLIHLWRIRYRRHTLPSTLLWSRVLDETPLRRPRRLPTRWLLLLLQLAVLLCGAVALARPAFVAAGGRHLLVAVDSSLSMGAGDVRPNRLARARDLVARLVDGLGAGDAITLVDAGATPRVLVTSGDHAALRRALGTLAPGDGPSSLGGDGALLAGLAASAGPRTATYLFAPVGTSEATLGALRGAVPGLSVRSIGTTDDDRAVADLSVSCLTGRTPGGTGACEAYARLVNKGAHPITTRVTATVDGRSSAEPLSLSLRANTSQQIHLPLPAGARTVELHLDGRDALPADDTAWAVVPRPLHRDILLVTGDPTSPLAQGLRAIPNVTLGTIAPDNGALGDVARRVDLVVLDGTGPDILPPGNLLFVNPTAGTALFDTVGSGETIAPVVTGLDRASPLLRNVDLGSLIVSAAARVALPGWARAVIAGDGGPLLFSGVTGGRRVAVLTFDPRPAAAANSSNLDTLLAFPALLQNIAQALAPAPPGSATAGRPGTIPLARRDAATLAGGAGAAAALPSAGDLAALPALRPGLYDVTGAAGGGKSAIAVNAEGPGADTSGAEGLGADAAVAPAPPAVLPAVPVPSTPWEGWTLGAVLALLLLGGEWWYYVRHT